MMGKEKHQPDWAKRAENIPSKPNWVDRVPHLLYELGEVFFPIPRGRKGWNYPHHMQEKRYHPESEILNAYLEAGFGYGIACAGDLVVVDIDEKEFVDELTEELPSTVYQVTGSREGVHLFYIVPGLNTRHLLHYQDEHDCESKWHTCVEEDGVCIKVSDWSHLGEIKCDPHGYVVGPGSVHPSGNIYGPLQGDKIAKVDKEEFLKVFERFDKPTDDGARYKSRTADVGDFDTEPRYDFYRLDADDVLPWLEPEKRIAHPTHGSSTNSNFMKQSDGLTFMCWRHNYGSGQGCALNAQQFLAVEATQRDCDAIRRDWQDEPELHWKAWKRAYEEGLVGTVEVPYRVLLGFSLERGIAKSDDDLAGETYWNAINALRYEINKEEMPPIRPLK